MKYPFIIVACLFMNTILAQETTTIYLIRHAEKAADGTDPGLSDAGKERTKVWGEYFEDKNIDIYYAAPYKRAQETVIGTVRNFSELPREFIIKPYDPISISLKQVADDNKGKSVLIVSDSNTIPTQINTFLRTNYHKDIPEGEYGHLYIIRIRPNGIIDQLVKM